MAGYYWVSDPGHGWLVVPRADVQASGAEISSYSFLSRDGRTAYLEEDADAPAFAVAAGIDGRDLPERQVAHFDRSLPAYTAASPSAAG